MVLLMLQLDGEVTGVIHLQMLLSIDGWEVNFIHEIVQVRFPVSEVLIGKLTILNLWVEVIGLPRSLSHLAISLPVKYLSNEIQSLLEILVESFKDNSVEVLNRELTIWTTTDSLVRDLVERAHLLLENACLVLLESIDLIVLHLELRLQFFNFLILGQEQLFQFFLRIVFRSLILIALALGLGLVVGLIKGLQELIVILITGETR